MRVSFVALAQAAVLALSAAASCSAPVGEFTKTFTTAEGLRYVYDYVPAKNVSKPTLLLLHGFPTSRHDWKAQIAALTAEGFGILAPDLLGFGDSSKPTSWESFSIKDISGHLKQLIHAQGLRDVVAVAHDWGAVVLGGAVARHPALFTKLAFISVGYQVAGIFPDIDAINVASRETFGYMQYGYWYFFNSYNAADLIRSNAESAFNLFFHSNASSWGVDFADIGSARAWLNANTTTESPTWLSNDFKTAWVNHYSQKDAMTSSLNIYKSMMRGTQAQDVVELTDEDRTLRVPVLAVGGNKDLVARADQQRARTEPWCTAGYEERNLDTSHWVMLEKPDELSEILVDFASS